ncbi:MAG: hypothetical protein ABR612_02520 [Chromatocurvus sp.]
MALALRKRPPPTPDLQSRLLPMLLGETALSATRHLRILDFGRANRHSLAFYSELPCRLQVLDASDILIAKAKEIRADAEGDKPAEVTADDFDAAFPEIAGQGFDLVLLWDMLNLVPARALPALLGFIRRHTNDGFRGHGFMLHKRSVESAVRHLGVTDASTLRVVATDPASLYLHTRKYVNDSMSPLTIDHGVLHSDGRLEFLFRNRSPA